MKRVASRARFLCGHAKVFSARPSRLAVLRILAKEAECARCELNGLAAAFPVVLMYPDEFSAWAVAAVRALVEARPKPS